MNSKNKYKEIKLSKYGSNIRANTRSVYGNELCYIGSEIGQHKAQEMQQMIIHSSMASFKRELGIKINQRPKDNKYFYIKYENEIFLNLMDAKSISQTFLINKNAIVPGIKFALESFANNREVFIHCDEGQSRSPMFAFIIDVIINHKQNKNFEILLKDFSKTDKDIKIGAGIKSWLEKEYPFNDIKEEIKKPWIKINNRKDF